MRRFVTVWTLRRGVVDPPEPLSADGQEAAFLQVHNDATRERAVSDCRVVWAEDEKRRKQLRSEQYCYEPDAARMMELARKVRIG